MKKEEDREKQKEEEKHEEMSRRRIEKELEIKKKKLEIQKKSYGMRGEIVREERCKIVEVDYYEIWEYTYRLMPPLEPAWIWNW